MSTPADGSRPATSGIVALERACTATRRAGVRSSPRSVPMTETPRNRACPRGSVRRRSWRPHRARGSRHVPRIRAQRRRQQRTVPDRGTGSVSTWRRTGRETRRRLPQPSRRAPMAAGGNSARAPASRRRCRGRARSSPPGRARARRHRSDRRPRRLPADRRSRASTSSTQRLHRWTRAPVAASRPGPARHRRASDETSPHGRHGRVQTLRSWA